MDLIERQPAGEEPWSTDADCAHLFAHSPAPMWVHDEETLAFLNVNRAAMDLYGYTRDEFLRMTVSDICAPEEAALLKAHLGTADAPEHSLRSWRHRGRNGKGLNVLLSSQHLERQGRPVRIVLVTDVTARKHALEALRQSEERYRIVESITHDVVWEWNLKTGELRHNNSLIGVFGYDPADTHRDGQWWYDHTHPEDRDRVVEAIWAIIGGAESYWSGEYRFARADGEWIHVLDRGYVMRSEAGEPLRMIGSMSDITEQKHIEATLRFLAAASEDLAASLDYHTTLANLARTIIPFLADYCTIDVFLPDGSARRLALAHQDPEREAELRTVQAPYFTGSWKPHRFLEALRRGEPQLVPDTDALKDQWVGEYHVLQATYDILGSHSYMGVPLCAQGQPIGAIHFTVSTAHRRYTTADLALAGEVARRASVAIENALLHNTVQHNDTAKEEFLAMLGHELRNPLGAITNALQLIRLRQQASPSVQATLDVVERQARQMARLVDDLLDVSRIARGKVEIRRQPTPLAALMEQCAETAAPIVQARRHTLDLRLPDGPIWVDADGARLCQVFDNLLNNAAKYTLPGGHITFSAWRENGEAVIRVRDTGQGIAPELLEAVFDLFTQGEHSAEAAHGGLGIGLTVARSLVEMHGGTLRAHSAGLGEGSEFTVRLPTVADPSPDPNVAFGDECQPAPQHPLRVLLVEDNVDAARTLGEILAMWGYTVQLAHDGPTALEVAGRTEADVVLLDIGLPGMDGYEVVRRLKGDGVLPAATLVALTGYGQEDDQRRSQEAGFHHHLVKPVDFLHLRTLLAAIRP